MRCNGRMHFFVAPLVALSLAAGGADSGTRRRRRAARLVRRRARPGKRREVRDATRYDGHPFRPHRARIPRQPRYRDGARRLAVGENERVRRSGRVRRGAGRPVLRAAASQPRRPRPRWHPDARGLSGGRDLRRSTAPEARVGVDVTRHGSARGGQRIRDRADLAVHPRQLRPVTYADTAGDDVVRRGDGTAGSPDLGRAAMAVAALSETRCPTEWASARAGVRLRASPSCRGRIPGRSSSPAPPEHGRRMDWWVSDRPSSRERLRRRDRARDASLY